MGPGTFGSFAVFVILAAITAAIAYLAAQQSKIKHQIDERRREQERDQVAALGGVAPTTPATPPDVGPRPTPEAARSSLPIITPGGTPVPPARPPLRLLDPPDTSEHQPPDAGEYHEEGGGERH
jgi:hypothetical protein